MFYGGSSSATNSTNPFFFLLFLPIFSYPTPAEQAKPSPSLGMNLTPTTDIPTTTKVHEFNEITPSYQRRRKAALFPNATIAFIESCDFWGLTIYIARNPLQHVGMPYIAGHPHDKACPKLEPGPSANEWYMSWTLKEMNKGLCGKVIDDVFTTQVNIGECDCEFMTENDYTSVINCGVGKKSGLTRSTGEDDLPEEVKFTLSQEAAVKTLDPDKKYGTVDLPTINAVIRKKDGSPITSSDVINLGQPLDIFIEMTVHHDYWVHIAVQEMVMQGLTDKTKSFDVITGMCLGVEKIENAVEPSSPYEHIAADQLQICSICSAAIQQFGISYDASTLHGFTITIPFNVFTFRDELMHGVEVSLQVTACTSKSSSSCTRNDCPAISKKRKRRSSPFVFGGSTSTSEESTDLPPSLAKYDVNLRLKVNPHNGTNATRKPIKRQKNLPIPEIIASPPTTTPEVLAKEKSTENGMWVEMALIIVGVVAVFILLVPCLYAIYRNRLQHQSTDETSLRRQQRVEVIKVLDPQVGNDEDNAALLYNAGREQYKPPEPSANHSQQNLSSPTLPQKTSPSKQPSQQLFKTVNFPPNDSDENEEIILRPTSSSFEDSIPLEEVSGHELQDGHVKLLGDNTQGISEASPPRCSVKKTNDSALVKSLKRAMGERRSCDSGVTCSSDQQEEHYGDKVVEKASDELPRFICSKCKITMEQLCEDSQV